MIACNRKTIDKSYYFNSKNTLFCQRFLSSFQKKPIFVQKNQKMNWQDYIVSDKNILLGKPTIKGTRLSIEFIIERLANGWTEEQLLENYPKLTKEALKAVFAYIHNCLQDGLMFQMPSKAA
jgi:uncharacterized protein (DUF433 family)